MHNKLAFLFIGVLFFSNVYSQVPDSISAKKENNNYFRISYGFVLPSGDYSSKDNNSAKSGFANFGSEFAMTAGFNFLTDFHYLIEWNGYSNNIDKTGLAEYYSNQVSSLLDWEVKSSPWSNSNIMTGLGLSFKIKKIFLDSDAMIGYSYAVRPEMLIISSDEANEYITRIRQSTSTSLSWKFRMGVRYNIYKKISVWGNVSNLSSKHQFETELETTNSNYEILKAPEDIRFNNFTFSLGLGLIW